MIMTGAALTADQRGDLPRSLKGNICRCTGYRAIADAFAGVSSVDRRGRSPAAGGSLGAPAARDVVTGDARFTPVAPAPANAIRDATGVRFAALPLTRDRVFLGLARHAAAASVSVR